ncbi:sugar phosphate isomerase/epimerase family protein [Cyclobacterium marinum]|uniref:Xylose isomerase domain-containing protein TIM barrel n=1 Tax=Cyclobacterium marinum (strain ATCC 25205 / DSM 745 / LMG 13164 / NCIMB 1802) TaxID=880070 RepID=G0IX38_CYCMS|nr:sugar phosphate isomerase/epimerase family protein [Cyclobacterium marinum]AEL25586.1 Xylose isomerase domain-containing protein TIM barrel [Cyclobacterium marinum DSM 745]MBI0401020.1 sugar phosphate isomerase/epimerase [Cyclobacterium marinum]|tara:strand:+ start:2991 stop:3947 length:957 start_codon:yes stop_codon:yes gene_type:complete
MHNRRDFIKKTGLATAILGLGLGGQAISMAPRKELFKISLAQWSVNRLLFNKKMDNLDFAVLAKKHGISAVEYVNQFFMDKAKDMAYLKEMKTRAEGEGVTSVLIMCDNEGKLGARDEAERMQTVENHKKWVEAAKFLGCHSIRVNGYSFTRFSADKKDFAESQKLVADGLQSLCEFADTMGINVMIENHGGFSSDAKWLSGVIKAADHPRAGTLPDFGNFLMYREEGEKTLSYDSYKGVKQLMPYAKGVSVKPTVWDGKGNQSQLDYEKMLSIVLKAGYHGYCGIEHGEQGRIWESIVEVREELEAAEKALRSSFSV